MLFLFTDAPTKKAFGRWNGLVAFSDNSTECLNCFNAILLSLWHMVPYCDAQYHIDTHNAMAQRTCRKQDAQMIHYDHRVECLQTTSQYARNPTRGQRLKKERLRAG